MIEKPIGFSEHQNKERINTSIDLLWQNTDAKVKIDADYKKDIH